MMMTMAMMMIMRCVFFLHPKWPKTQSAPDGINFDDNEDNNDANDDDDNNYDDDDDVFSNNFFFVGF